MRITAAITTLMLAGIGLAFPGAVAQSNAATNRHCVLIDNDYDIDDMMAIPLVVGNRDVAAIIQTEGYTKPEHAAGAADALINHSVAGGNQRAIAIIAGGSQAGVKPLNAWPWLPFFRAMMDRSNGLLPTPARPWPRDPNYPAAVENAVAGCRHVTVLLTAPFTSWIHYAPRIRPKLRAVVITGRRLMDRSHTTRGNSFNCLYDLAACRTAMGMLDGIDASFIDLPDFPDCEGTTPQPSHCYSPNLAMVAGQRSTNGMTSGGLNPGVWQVGSGWPSSTTSSAVRCTPPPPRSENPAVLSPPGNPPRWRAGLAEGCCSGISPLPCFYWSPIAFRMPVPGQSRAMEATIWSQLW